MSAYRTDEEFERTMLRDDARIARYVERESRGSVRPAPFVMRDVEARNACYHQASNRHGRIRFMKLFLRLVREHVPEGVDVFFVTISPRAFVLPLAAADQVQLKSLMAFCRQAIGNRSALGVVEPALYRDCDAFGPRRGSTVVSWHAHLLVWGTVAAELRRHRAALGPRHVNISGRRSMWIRLLQRHELEIYARYLCKAPTKEYRLDKDPGEHIDRETGEVFDNCRQNKRELRPGDLVRLANIMKNLFTMDLVFGSGAGTRIARQITLELTAAQRREDDQEKTARGHSNMWENAIPYVPRTRQRGGRSFPAGDPLDDPSPRPATRLRAWVRRCQKDFNDL